MEKRKYNKKGIWIWIWCRFQKPEQPQIYSVFHLLCLTEPFVLITKETLGTKYADAHLKARSDEKDTFTHKGHQ